MFAIRNLIKANHQAVKNVIHQRNMSVVAVPARSKVTTGEMLFLSAIMVIGWSAIPAWVLVNIKNYRNKE